MGGLQAQYAPSMYVGLWSRLAGFERDPLTRALERRRVVHGTLMRSTIHLISARDYWPLALTVERPRREWWLKANRDGLGARDMSGAARRLRPRLAGGTLRGAARSSSSSARRRPPASAIGCTHACTRRPRAPGSTTARTSTRWPRTGSARPEIDHADAVDHTVRRYLRRPAPGDARRDRQLGGRSTSTTVAPALERLRLRRFASEEGDELVDLPRAAARSADAGTRPAARDLGRDPARPRPPRERPARALPRPRVFHVRMPQSVPTFLVDGAVAGAWRYDGGRVAFDPFERLDRATLRALREEGERMVALHA